MNATHNDDIAYIRALAEEGRTAPPLNGPIMIAAALIFGAASVAQWAIQARVLAVDPMAQLWVWVGAGVLFGLSLAALIRRAKHKPGYNGVRNQAIGAAWSGVGFLIFSVWLGMLAMGLVRGDWAPMALMPSVVFAAYGAAWTTAAAMSGQKWMNGVALAAYGGAALMGAFSGDPAGYLVFAALLMAVALVPGVILTRQEPTEVV